MKKILFLVAFSLFSASAFCLPTLDNDGGEFYFTKDGDCGEKPKAKKGAQDNKDEITLLLEAKGGYFFFTDSKMRKVYNNGGLDVQLALSGRLWKALHLYGSIEYIQRSGHSLNGNQATTIQIVPLSFGVKPTVSIVDTVDWYCNIGPRYFIIHQHNSSSYVPSPNENGLGGFVGTGFYFHLNRRLILDAYGEWSYFARQVSTTRTNVYTRSIDVGGFAFGGGLGYSF